MMSGHHAWIPQEQLSAASEQLVSVTHPGVDRSLHTSVSVFTW